MFVCGRLANATVALVWRSAGNFGLAAPVRRPRALPVLRGMPAPPAYIVDGSFGAQQGGWTDGLTDNMFQWVCLETCSHPARERKTFGWKGERNRNKETRFREFATFSLSVCVDMCEALTWDDWHPGGKPPKLGRSVARGHHGRQVCHANAAIMVANQHRHTMSTIWRAATVVTSLGCKCSNVREKASFPPSCWLSLNLFPIIII